MWRFSLATVIATPILAACSLSPQQSELTGISQVDIINNIRCEAKAAFAPYLNDPAIAESKMALGFEFVSLESDGLSGGASLLVPVHAAGALAFGLSAAESKSREGYDKIDIVDTVGKIDCVKADRRESRRLPITGTIGLADEIASYVELRAQRPMSIAHFQRQLKFKYTISGGVNPILTLVPVNHLQRASLDLSAARSETHQLIMILRAKPQAPEPLEVRIVNSITTTSTENVTKKKKVDQSPPSTGPATSATAEEETMSITKKSVLQGSRNRSTDFSNDALTRELDRQRDLNTYREIRDRIGPVP